MNNFKNVKLVIMAYVWLSPVILEICKFYLSARAKENKIPFIKQQGLQNNYNLWVI